MALTRFVAVYLAVAALAVGAALITLLIAPRQIAPVAAATVMLSAVSLALGIRQAVIDRGALHVDITLERYGISDDLVIQARVYNDGRRPVRIEELGFAAGKSRTIRYPSWTPWGRGNDDPVPMTLGESESQRLWTWPHLVARWYVNFEPSTWMFVTHVDGRPRWRKLRRTYAPHWQPGGLGSGRPTARSRRRRPRSLARSTPGATHRNLDAAE